MSVIKSKIRTIPDWPQKGVQFRDITSLLIDAEAFALTVANFVERYRDKGITKIAAIEARGFIPGAAIAFQLGIGFVPIRKKGKLPGEKISQEYDLEYGKDSVEIHNDSIIEGDKVLIIDDLVATGGTIEAAIQLVRRLKGEVYETAVIIDLPDLGGAKAIYDKYSVEVFSICKFDGH